MPKLSSDAETAPAAPRWITAIDIVCAVLLIFAIIAMVSRGVRISVATDIDLSFTSWPRLLMWIAVLLALRQWRWRERPWHATVFGWLRACLRNEAFRAAWPAFMLSRLSVLIVAYVAVVMIGFSPPRPWRALDNNVLDLYARWDAGWYYMIANVGYNATTIINPQRQNSIVFFPGFPMTMRYLGSWFHLNKWIAGIIIVIVAFLFGLIYLYRLAREDLPPDQARAALAFLAFYPFAVCYNAILTESLFLLVGAATFFYFRRRRLVVAGALALFVGLLRPNGFLFAGPLGLLALLPFARGRGWLPGSTADGDARWLPLIGGIAVALLPIAGMLIYSANVYSMTGDPFAWVKAQQGWGRSTAGILKVIEARRALIAADGLGGYAIQYPTEILEFGAALFALVAIWPITRRFGAAYGLFVALSVVPPLITMGSLSLGRFTAPLFPLFLWLGAAVPEQHRPYWLAAFGMGQGLVAVLFFTWRPPY